LIGDWLIGDWLIGCPDSYREVNWLIG